MRVAVIAAIPGTLAAIVAGLGWWRESKKDRSEGKRSDLDIVLGGLQDLLKDERVARDRTKAELGEAMKRALDCENREKMLSIRVSALEAAMRGD